MTSALLVKIYIDTDFSGAPNEISWQISAPQPGFSWLARETEQIQNPSWQTENTTIL